VWEKKEGETLTILWERLRSVGRSLFNLSVLNPEKQEVLEGTMMSASFPHRSSIRELEDVKKERESTKGVFRGNCEQAGKEKKFKRGRISKICSQPQKRIRVNNIYRGLSKEVWGVRLRP